MRNIFRGKRVKIEDSQPRPCKYSQALGEMLERFPISDSMPEGRPERMADESWNSWSVALENSLKLGEECSLVLPGSVTTPSLIRMLEPKTIYPYVVIRYIPGCGGAFPIEFISDESQQPKHEDSWRIVMSNPYKNGRLTSQARQAVLDITEVAFNRMRGRFRMYAVFAEDDCVCFELNGSRVQHTSAPSMTIDLSNNLRSPK
jgi:hypothetical protein